MAVPADERLEDYRAALADFAEAERLFSRAYAVCFGDEPPGPGLPIFAKSNRAGLLGGLHGAIYSLDDIVRRCVDRAQGSVALVAPSLRVRRAATFAARGRRG
jgi:hypothetical protein